MNVEAYHTSAAGDAPSAAGPGKIPSLDGLRAVSILMVIASHFALGFFFQMPLGSAAARFVSLFKVGALGVTIFFVISGYLITSLLLGELDRAGGLNLKRFYFRRTLRIFPPLYAYLVIMAILSAMRRVDLAIPDFLASFSYVSDYFSTRWVTAHTWSLGVEEQFYLLWPLCLRYTSLQKCRWICLLVICLAPVARVYAVAHGLATYQFIRFHEVADSLAMGCFLALTIGRDARRYSRYLIPGLEWLAAACALLLSWLPNHGSLCPAWLYAAFCVSAINVAVGIALITVVQRTDRLAARLLNARGCVFIGVVSYSLYLWQQCFISPYHVWNWRDVAATLVCILAAAMASYFVVEQPSLRLRARWEKRLFGGQIVRSLREASLTEQIKE